MRCQEFFELCGLTGVLLAGAVQAAEVLVPMTIRDGSTLQFQQVPHRLRGIGTYSATNSVCALIDKLDLPCQDVIDIAERPTSPIGTFRATLTLSNSVLGFDGSFSFGPTPVALSTTISGAGTVF